MKVEPNRLESDRFGVSFARLTDPVHDREAAEALLQEADGQGTDVISARVDADDLPTVRMLEDGGFRIMDTLVYYQRDLPAPDLAMTGPEIIPGSAEHVPACAQIAARAFSGYLGHYHADPRLDAEAADLAYVDWTSRLLTESADGQIALCAVIDGQVSGFLIGVRRGEAASEIVLNAVDPGVEGQGCYGALLRRYLRHAGGRGDRQVVISTQLQNYRVQRAWRREGFHLFGSFHTLHRWRAAR